MSNLFKEVAQSKKDEIQSAKQRVIDERQQRKDKSRRIYEKAESQHYHCLQALGLLYSRVDMLALLRQLAEATQVKNTPTTKIIFGIYDGQEKVNWHFTRTMQVSIPFLLSKWRQAKEIKFLELFKAKNVIDAIVNAFETMGKIYNLDINTLTREQMAKILIEEISISLVLETRFLYGGTDYAGDFNFGVKIKIEGRQITLNGQSLDLESINVPQLVTILTEIALNPERQVQV